MKQHKKKTNGIKNETKVYKETPKYRNKERTISIKEKTKDLKTQIKTTKNILVKVRQILPYFPKNSKPKAKPLFSTKYITNQGKTEKLSPISKLVLI